MSGPPTFRAALRFWCRLGFISFGGPAGQIAIMHAELVERKRWIDEARFLRALNFCMLLPGPEATQLAAYCGWLLHGVRGALAAGLLFIGPGVVTLWTLSWIYAAWGAWPAVAAVFHGLKAAVLAIVVTALWRIARRALRSLPAWTLAALAFGALFFLAVPFPWVVFGALAAGFAWPRMWPAPAGGAGETAGRAVEPRGRDTLRLAALGLAAWFAPVLAAGLWQGWDGPLVRIGWFFSKAAVVTFGGAYAVLPYVAQQAVGHFHWLAPGQMLDGLAFAETTPGPLIMVVQYVGFMAGWQQPGTLSPLGAATLGAAMTSWVTFVPTYLFILLGAPWVERAQRHPRLQAALAAVTAAVVGVVLNLAVWFGWHALRPPDGGVDRFAVGLGVAAFAALQSRKLGLVSVIAISGVAGWLWHLIQA